MFRVAQRDLGFKILEFESLENEEYNIHHFQELTLYLVR